MGGCVCVHMYLSRYLGMGAFVEYRCCFCDIIITCLSAGFGVLGGELFRACLAEWVCVYVITELENLTF